MARRRRPWDKVEDNFAYHGRSEKFSGKVHKDIMKTQFRTFGDTWIESAIRNRMKQHVALALDIRDDQGRIAPHLVDLKSEFLDTLKGVKGDIEYRTLTMDDLRRMCKEPVDWEYWRERTVKFMLDSLVHQKRPMPTWWLSTLRVEVIQTDRAMRGMVIRRQIPYQESGVTQVPGEVWRWDTVGNIVKHQRSKPGKTFRGHRDDVRTSDDAKTPAHTDMVCCERCGRVYYVPNIDDYPGDTQCYQCDPWVWGIVAWKKDGSGPIMIPMRLAEKKAREDNVGRPEGKKKPVSVAYRTGASKMDAAIARMKEILAAGGRRVDTGEPISLDFEAIEANVKIRKRPSKTKPKMDKAMERLANIVGKKRV